MFGLSDWNKMKIERWKWKFAPVVSILCWLHRYTVLLQPEYLGVYSLLGSLTGVRPVSPRQWYCWRVQARKACLIRAKILIIWHDTIISFIVCPANHCDSQTQKLRFFNLAPTSCFIPIRSSILAKRVPDLQVVDSMMWLLSWSWHALKGTMLLHTIKRSIGYFTCGVAPSEVHG